MVSIGALYEKQAAIGGAGGRIIEWWLLSSDFITRRAYINNLFVEAEHRRCGVARLLTKYNANLVTNGRYSSCQSICERPVTPTV